MKTEWWFTLVNSFTLMNKKELHVLWLKNVMLNKVPKMPQNGNEPTFFSSLRFCTFEGFFTYGRFQWTVFSQNAYATT